KWAFRIRSERDALCRRRRLQRLCCWRNKPEQLCSLSGPLCNGTCTPCLTHVKVQGLAKKVVGYRSVYVQALYKLHAAQAHIVISPDQSQSGMEKNDVELDTYACRLSAGTRGA